MSLRQLLKERDGLLVNAYNRIEFLEQTLKDLADLKSKYFEYSQSDSGHEIAENCAFLGFLLILSLAAPVSIQPLQIPITHSGVSNPEKKPVKPLSFKKIASSKVCTATFLRLTRDSHWHKQPDKHTHKHPHKQINPSTNPFNHSNDLLKIHQKQHNPRFRRRFPKLPKTNLFKSPQNYLMLSTPMNSCLGKPLPRFIGPKAP